MKLPYYLLAGALCLGLAVGACNDGPTDVSNEAAISTPDNTAVAKKESKVDICHWDANGWDNLPDQTEPGAYFHLNVNNNAWISSDKKNPHDKNVGHAGHELDQWYCTDGNDETTARGTYFDPSLGAHGEEVVCSEQDDGADNAVFCEEDSDGDGYSDDSDNCPYTYNPDQLDSDGGGVGDACDNCPFTARDNENQADRDDDEVGDACDNCIDTPNTDQLDDDTDGIGNACDECTDVDEDGYGVGYAAETCDLDCDDTDPAVNPDATEVCNGVDDNCDTQIDEGDVCSPDCAAPTQFGSLGDCDDTVQCPHLEAFCYSRHDRSGICAYELDPTECSGYTTDCATNGDADCAPDEVCLARACGSTGQVCVPVGELCPTPVIPDDTAVIPRSFGPNMSH